MKKEMLMFLLFFVGLVGGCAKQQCPAIPTSPAAPEISAVAASEPPPAPPLEAVTSEQALTRLLTTSPVSPAWFNEAFLEAVPVPKLTKIVAGMAEQLGALQKVQQVGEKVEATFEKGVVLCSVTLDSQGRFAGLWFGPPRLTAVSLEETLAALRALPGKVSVLVIGPDGKDVAAIDPEVPLAVGSAFKLAILKAVKARVASKKATWKTIVELEPRYRSLPSGDLRLWPDKTPLTLATLAGLMISQSDNTATDALLDWVGRDKVERHAPRNAPFLSTREAFVLKSQKNGELLERYRKTDEAGRRALLRELAAAPLPKVADMDEAVTSDVEWFFTARELCALLDEVADLPAFTMNPGLADKAQFDSVAFKGGSEPGVLNFTTRVTNNGKPMCVVATWNDQQPVEQPRLVRPYQALLSAARERLAAPQ